MIPRPEKLSFRLRRLAAACACIAACVAAPAAELRVAAAASLAPVLPQLAAAFQREAPGTVVRTTLGSSGSLVAQIRHGAPFAVFLAADAEFPRALVASGDAAADTLVVYARGALVLWTRRAELDPAAGLELVADARVRRVAIANPDLAPYGRAARTALQAAGFWEAAQAKIVLGENVAQTAQFVETGNADVGLVAKSAVAGRDAEGRFIEIDAELYPPLDQAAVVTQRGTAEPAARAFLVFLVSPAAAEIFRAHGFSPAVAGGESGAR